MFKTITRLGLAGLMAFTALFVVSYVLAYLAIVRFKVPSWLRR